MTAVDEAGGPPKHHEATQSEKLVIAASSLGTVFEWYDFYLYGLLATIISAQFFSGVNETTGFIFALAAFAAMRAAEEGGVEVAAVTVQSSPPADTEVVTAGVVLQPRFIPGLALTADYFNIRIKEVIGTPSPEGVYFYVCKVREIRLAGLSIRKLKGVVHLMRTGEPTNEN